MIRVFGRSVGLASAILMGAVVLPTGAAVSAIVHPLELVGPAGSGCFGTGMFPLLSGNIVVTDPCWEGSKGAVYLYDGATLTAISRLTGSRTGDRVGEDVTVLTNGNYLVVSRNWTDDSDTSVGAVSWGSGTTGVSGVVSSANSLTSLTTGDIRVTVLTNGNYVMSNPFWNNGLGAVTWGNGDTGTSGKVSGANSLIGEHVLDQVGAFVTPLANGHYVVSSPFWDDGALADVGAITWRDGFTPSLGFVSASNSLVGSHSFDGYWQTPLPGTSTPFTAFPVVAALTDGNYVVGNGAWDGQIGAATWASGMTGIAGVVSSANSLVGSNFGDRVGTSVTALANGNYVVGSGFWDNGAIVDAGAATWGNGDTGTVGVVSAANSLVDAFSDAVHGLQITPLTNGNYVVADIGWNNDAGAVTWGNGETGTTGEVSAANSLVGAKPGDQVGSVTALTNGNFVVTTPGFDLGAVPDVGAATWVSGVTGAAGEVSADNSLVGVTSFAAVTALANGNYVVGSPFWNNGDVLEVGAATWGNGASGTVGVVSSAISLIGEQPFDKVGWSVAALANGHYLVGSPSWHYGTFGVVGSASEGGAVTWGNGATGATGLVSPVNSLVGTHSGDHVGSRGVFGSQGTVVALPTGDAVVLSPDWHNGSFENVGAATPMTGTGSTVGAVTTGNSLIGDADGAFQVVAFERMRQLTLISRPGANRISILAPPSYVALLPARLLETRVDQPVGTIDGAFEATVAVASGSVLELSVGGRGGVPFDADSVVLNVTVTEPVGPGFVTAYPCGESRPLASNLTYAGEQTTANSVIAKLGADGKVCVYTMTTTQLIVDVNGYFVAGSGYVSMNPARLLESRRGEPLGTIDAISEGFGPLTAGTVTELQVAGRAGVPTDAVSAVLNLTVTQPQGAGYLTVFPCGVPRPWASNLNYTSGQTFANVVNAKLGADGKVCIYTLAGTHLVVDINGYHEADTKFVGITPSRFLETRFDQPSGTVDGLFQGTGAIPGGTAFELQIGDRGPIPGASAVALNVTVTQPQASGFVTVYPCGSPRPLASNLNYTTGQTTANAVIAKLGVGRKICLYTNATTHIIVDVNGYVP